MYYIGVEIPLAKGQFEGKSGGPLIETFCNEPCKTAELIEMPFGMLSRVDPKMHVLEGAGHIGATWRIRLNRPCAAAMWSYSLRHSSFCPVPLRYNEWQFCVPASVRP